MTSDPVVIKASNGCTATLYCGDVRAVLPVMPDASVHCCVTSPPYFGLRDYGVGGQIGLEQTPDAYVAEMVSVFREVRRVLRDDGTLWLNLGDSYAANRGYQVPDGKWQDVGNSKGMSAALIGLKPKDLIGIPWRVAFALQADGWYLRSDIIWHKPNPMPESVTDRPTKAHEYLFLLAKSERYYYDHEAIKEDASAEGIARRERNDFREKEGWAEAYSGNPPEGLAKKSDKQRGHSRRHAGFDDRWDAMEREQQCSGKRNKRDVWTVTPANYPEAHFATFPPKLIEPCIKAGCPQGGTVLDPFGGSGTTGAVALALGCSSVLCELNPAYIGLSERRIRAEAAQHKMF